MSKPLIVCRDLVRRYGNLTVINGLTLEVREGEFIALLGPSGCGKTTVLRLIAGFDRPDGGVIEIAGRRVNDAHTFVPPEQRRVGMVFQEYALFPHLTVAGNVAYGLAQLPRREREQRVREVLALVGLNGLEDRLPGELSGGQQQRVALARALAPRPDVVLLDEPFSNLDAGLRTRLRVELRDILHQARATTIFVTHDQEEALSLADRVAVLQDGRITQIAPPEELYRAPATREIAAFVGETNFLPAYAEGESATCALGRVTLARPHYGAVEVLIRPEWITAQADPDGDALVIRRMYFGHDQLMIVRTDEGLELQVRLGPDQAFQRGERVCLTVNGPVVAYPQMGSNGKQLDKTVAPLVFKPSGQRQAGADR